MKYAYAHSLKIARRSDDDLTVVDCVIVSEHDELGDAIQACMNAPVPSNASARCVILIAGGGRRYLFADRNQLVEMGNWP